MESENTHTDSFDAVVLGAGPAGIHAAGLLAAGGKRVAIIEKDKIGGCCTHVGCIPTKLLRRETQKEPFSWRAFSQKRREMTSSIEEGLRLTLLSRGVRIVESEGEVLNEHQILLHPSEKIMQAEKIIVSTGSRPQIPRELLGCPALVTMDSFWDLEELPKKIAIIGGGVIGCELVSALKDQVEQIYLIEKENRILEGFSQKACDILTDTWKKSAVQILTGQKIVAYKTSEGKDETEVILENIDGEKTVLSADRILLAAGRKADSDFSKQHLEAIEYIGDVTGAAMTAYAAKRQAEQCAHKILENSPTKTEIGSEQFAEATCVFTNPEMARIGMTKQQALEKGFHPVEGKAPFYALGMAKIWEDIDGYFLLCRDEETDCLLGAEFVGQGSCELIHLLMPYLLYSIPCQEMRRLTFAHPTMAEGIKIALEETYQGSVELPLRRRRRDKR